jgi:MYXO-CTERM domain-containing protein
MEHNMNKTLGVTLTTVALLFGGAGVSHATATTAPIPTSTTSTLAADTDNTDDGDNTGLWGLAGLLGLIGLAGLKRRNERPVVAPNVAHGPGTAPR